MDTKPTRTPGPRVRVSGFIPLDDSVLLVCQQRSAERAAAPYWLLPGGGVSQGESLHDALARELHEELGVVLQIGEPIALVESISPDPDYPKHVLHVILAAVWPPACEPDLVHGEGNVDRPYGEQEGHGPRGDQTIDDLPRVHVADPAVLAARFVRAAELEHLDLRPPLTAFLRRRLSAPTDHRRMEYLGRLW